METTTTFLKSSKKNIMMLFFFIGLIALCGLQVSGQNMSCLSVPTGVKYAFTDPGECIHTAPTNFSLDIQFANIYSCITEKSKWSFTYVLDGSTIGAGSTTLNGVNFNQGLTGVTWTGVYSTTGATTVFPKFFVQIRDNELPLINCGAGLTLTTDPGMTGATVTYPEVTATDNCGIDTIFIKAGLVSGSFFPIGTTTIQYNVVDINGNSDSCTFDVVVNDLPPKSCCDGYDVDIVKSRISTFCTTNTAVDLTAKATTFTCPDNTAYKLCYESPTNPDVVHAAIQWTYWTLNNDNTITIRTTFSKTFVDNTYGTNAIGWPSGHTFSNLTGSDRLALALYDNNDVKRMEFYMDYITASTGAPSGYKCLGVTGGEGSMVLGNVSDVINVTSSINENFNVHGYVLPVNSPATDANYTPNPAYPNWIYDVWYEVTVKASAFGYAGFGKPDITYIHASPSKTGHNSEEVVPVVCGSAPGDVTTDYLWSTGETTQKISVNTPGTYTVTATANTGCVSTESVVVTDPTPSPITDYVILTRDYILLDHSTVYTGGLGVTNLGTTIGKLEVKNYSSVTAASTVAQASNLMISANSQVGTPIYDGANIPFPVFEPMNYEATKKASIPDNATVYLSDTLYKEVLVGKNATVVFTKSAVNIKDRLVLNDGANLKFAQCGKIRLKNTMDCGVNVNINPEEKFVQFYIGSDVTFKAGSHVNGYFLLADITKTSDTLYHQMIVKNSTAANPAVFKGIFMGQAIISGQYTNWYKSDMCNYCPSPTPSTWTCPEDMTICESQEDFVLRDLYPEVIQGVSLISNDQPAVFPIGTTTVTWTIVDNYGVITHCTQHITRSPAISVIINKAGLFCENSYKLKATVTDGTAASYLWSTGETTPDIIASAAGGIYTVTVTTQQGCDTTYTVDMSVDTTDMIPQYLLFARDIITIKQTTINSGGLGVLTKGRGKEIKILEGSSVMESGSFVKATKINADAVSVVAQRINSIANVILPVFERNRYPSSVNVTIPVGGTTTLTDTIYNTITVNQNATLIFTQETVNIQQLILKEGATVRFAYVCGKLRIKSAIAAEKLVTINPEKKSVLIYVENDVSFKEGADVSAIFYLTNAGKLDRTFTISDYNTTKPNAFEGMVLAKTINIGKNTSCTLNNFCLGCSVIRIMDNTNTDNTADVKEISINNSPNPFTKTTSIFFTLPDDNHVTIDVYTLEGKHIATLFDGNTQKNQEYKVDFDGSSLSAGIYIYKMSTNKEVLTGKMTMFKL